MKIKKDTSLPAPTTSSQSLSSPPPLNWFNRAMLIKRHGQKKVCELMDVSSPTVRRWAENPDIAGKKAKEPNSMQMLMLIRLQADLHPQTGDPLP